MRIAIGRKKGMTQVFDSVSGKVVPATIIDVDNLRSVELLKTKSGEISHVVIGKDSKRTKSSNKADLGKYKDGVPVYKLAAKVADLVESDLVSGKELDMSLFSSGSLVDVRATTKGKGFQGVVKKWGFKGGPKTHGQSDKHRHPGSIGAGTYPGRVMKGLKMAGKTGNKTKTVKNLVIVELNSESKILLLRGAVPGPIGGYVEIKLNKMKK